MSSTRENAEVLGLTDGETDGEALGLRDGDTEKLIDELRL